MSERFDDLATSMAGESPLSRRSVVRGVLVALGFGAGAIAVRPQAAVAAAARPVRCQAGLTACGNLCRDLSSNSTNCGACGTVCPNDSVCRDGKCVKVTCTCDPACPPGLTWCGACVNTATDAAHCGNCTTVCPNGQICSNGTCAPAPQCATAADCPGTDTACKSRTCSGGVCGFAFAAAGTVCPGGVCNGSGQCNQQCQPGFILCNGVCVDPSTDLANCGGCGNHCPSPANATATCVSGTCGFFCNAGYGDCDGAPTTGCETYINTDTHNCGGCGVVCAGPNASSACNGGNCVILGCSPGFADCDNNPNTGCETNVTTSVNNCGGCGIACSGPNAISACSNGACVIAGCNAGYADCDGNPATGCETNITTSVNNCGGCGIVCSGPNAISACSNGNCVIAGCNPGYADCDGNPASGCETNVTTDTRNCGGCGIVCPSGKVCSNGACV